MSMKALPLLYLNLGGEMMYILDQRLKAQNIPKDKAKKVLLEIISAMFTSRLVDELFKPQDLYTKKSVRTMFDHLAHASIMRLNEGSMDKLYDLMTMAVKYQVSLVKRPQDLVLVTLNHLDVLHSYVAGSPAACQQVEAACRLLRQVGGNLPENHGSMTPGQLMQVRQKLLGFFQDTHVRVSLFLRDSVQDNSGKFIINPGGPVAVGIEVPGKIRLYGLRSAGERFKTVEFSSGAPFSPCSRDGSYEPNGDRVIQLGRNMYEGVSGSQAEASVSRVGNRSSVSDYESSAPDPRAKAQLDLLSQLIGARRDKGGQRAPMPEFKLSLFNTDEEEGEGLMAYPVSPSASGGHVISIDASKRKQSAELSRVMGDLGDLHVDSRGAYSTDDDLLDLMDNA